MSIPSMMLGPGLAAFPEFRCNGGVAAQYQAQAHFIRSCPFLGSHATPESALGILQRRN
jgi:hypothetical protein